MFFTADWETKTIKPEVGESFFRNSGLIECFGMKNLKTPEPFILWYMVMALSISVRFPNSVSKVLCEIDFFNLPPSTYGILPHGIDDAEILFSTTEGVAFSVLMTYHISRFAIDGKWVLMSILTLMQLAIRALCCFRSPLTLLNDTGIIIATFGEIDSASLKNSTYRFLAPFNDPFVKGGLPTTKSNFLLYVIMNSLICEMLTIVRWISSICVRVLNFCCASSGRCVKMMSDTLVKPCCLRYIAASSLCRTRILEFLFMILARVVISCQSSLWVNGVLE